MSETFTNAYNILKTNAAKLQNNTEPNIDELLDIVKESTAAYNTCKERIEAVEQALNETLNGKDNTATVSAQDNVDEDV